jgi:parallel beta-helix repeat protein
LKHSSFINGGYGIYVYSPYSHITADYCLIADNVNYGIYVRASSDHVFNNCTIVGNSTAGIHLGASNLKLTNCVVAFNTTGLNHSGDTPSVTIEYSTFYNPGGQEIVWDGDPGEPDLASNNNSVVDPQFIDKDAANYELADGSLCIDSGNAQGNLGYDLLYRPMNDDFGMPNVGSGYPSYVDRGAFERQTDTNGCDLFIDSLSSPDPILVSSGGSFNITYGIANNGLSDCVGPWDTVLYLSDDQYIDPDDLIIGGEEYTGTLEPGTNYESTFNVTVPDTNGPKFVILQANGDQSLSESDTANNTAVSPEALAVNVPLLELNTPVTGTVIEDNWVFYRFEAQSGNSIRFYLENIQSDELLDLYLLYSIPPNVNEFDAIGQTKGTGIEAKLLEPQDGIYYIGIFASNLPDASTQYSLVAELTEFGIESVPSNTVGTAGTATIEIVGNNFSPTDQVQLVSPDGETILTPTQIHYIDPSHVMVTFDFNGALLGNYDVLIQSALGGVSTLMDAVEVVDAAASNFQADLTLPGTTRPGRIIEARVDYSNTGTNDIPSPILTLDCGADDCEWQLPWQDQWVVGSEFRFMGLSSDGPPTLLRPGQTESITVKLRIPLRPEDITVTLSSVGADPTDGSSNQIDWVKFESDVWPNGIADPDSWSIAFANLKTQIGNTWGDYANKLRENAGRLFRSGRRVYSVIELFGMEMDKAFGFSTGLISGTIVDTSANYPIAGVSVRLFDAEGYLQNTTMTQTDGSFLMFNLAAGTYSLTVDGYSINEGAEIELITDLYMHTVSVKLAGNVSGIVYGPSGTAISGASIRLVHSNFESRYATTDTDGHYNITNIQDGAWQFFVFSDGLVLPEPEIVDIDGASNIELDIYLTTGASISGSVTDTDGHEVIGASVFAYTTSGTYSSATTDSNGHYVLNGLAAGDCQITVSAPNYKTVYQTINNLDPNDAFEDYNFMLQAGIQISGRVTDALADVPLSNVSLFMITGEKLFGKALTNSDGIFTNKQNISGDYTIYCALEGYDSAEHTVEVPSNGMTDPLELTLSPLTTGDSRESDAFDSISLSTKYVLLYSTSLAWGSIGWHEAGSHLFHFLNPPFNTGLRGGEPFYYGPSDGVSEIVMNEDRGLVVFSSVRQFVEEKIRSKISPSVCSTGHQRGIAGTCPPLDFTASSPNWNLMLAFGGMGEGRYEFRNPMITHQNNGITISGIVDYYFSDLYTYDKTDREHIAPANWGYELANNGWGTPFETTIHIQDSIDIPLECPEEPEPDDDEEDSDSTDVRTSYTPEDKFGPMGYNSPGIPEENAEHYVSGNSSEHGFDYRIEFWNKEDAPVPTQDAIIVDTLDPNIFDLSTFEFTRIGFLKWDIPLPGGKVIDTRIDTRPDMEIAVDITANFNPDTGKAQWWFHAIDPLTGDWPEDPYAGFLPPFNPDTGFEIGWVEFRVKPRPDLPNNTQITNQAFVEFDFAGDLLDHPAPKDGPWINTLDSIAPTSQIYSAYSENTNIILEWSGEAAEEGSGLSGYDVYVSVDDGAYTKWLNKVATMDAVFDGENGHSYGFYTIAIDNAGNREAAPDTADATVTIEGVALSGDFNDDGDVDGLDLFEFSYAIANNHSSADLNGNGSYDNSDVEIFAENFGKRPQ